MDAEPAPSGEKDASGPELRDPGLKPVQIMRFMRYD